MSRLTDVSKSPQWPTNPPLPVVDWKKINNKAPENLEEPYEGPTASLPKADIVVVTWTTAEWSALDHVFCNSDTPRSGSDSGWQKQWHFYSKNAPPPETGSEYKFWGSYRLVQITGASGNAIRVLLFKSDTHLAYYPYVDGLSKMTNQILSDTGATKLYSIGTAGGAGLANYLGNTYITNSGHLAMILKDNKDSPLNNNTYSCTDWFPDFKMIDTIQKELMIPLSNVASLAEYDQLFEILVYKMQNNKPPIDITGITVSDLVNEPLEPKNLNQPTAVNSKDKPLLTTDFYYISHPGDAEKYCVLEMDDTVLGQAAGAMGVSYAFVRNISDTVVPDKTSGGEDIPAPAQQEWSSLIYETYGLYTSYNGALATWATIAAM